MSMMTAETEGLRLPAHAGGRRPAVPQNAPAFTPNPPNRHQDLAGNLCTHHARKV